MPKQDKVPPSVIGRLTKYLTYVQILCSDGVGWVSSRELAERLGLTSATVRHDISHVNFSGISKRGYETEGLQRVLAGMLGVDTTWNMVVVGAGNLGCALALHEDFGRRGFNICGIFDNDPGKVGNQVGALVVKDMRELSRFVRARQVDIGVIAVPSAAAQAVSEAFVDAGVKGLLNLALAHIVVPDDICVVDSRIVASVMELSHALKFKANAAN